MISYDGLWKVMKERGISQYALINQYGISPAQLTRLRHNEGVNTHTIDMFCRILDCEVGDTRKQKGMIEQLGKQTEIPVESFCRKSENRFLFLS